MQLKEDDLFMTLPEFENFNSKTEAIMAWLRKILSEGLKNSKICENDKLPLKSVFANKFKVSSATIQNAFDGLKDEGLLFAKKRSGMFVSNPFSKTEVMRYTSKRDLIVEKIKDSICHFEIGCKVESARSFAKKFEVSLSTVNSALKFLCMQSFLENRDGKLYVAKKISKTENIKAQTIVEKIANEIEKEILINSKSGDKLPSNHVLAKKFNVSIKTINDAVKILSDKKIIMTRRGQYGTIILKASEKREDMIFAPAKDAAFYYYEKVQHSIKKMIAQNFEIGSKLPSIREMSQEFGLNANTIRKALKNLAEDGYVIFERGRYGGTIVTNIPDMSAQSFKWLAVNPQYVAAYN